jgi:hypothetical protein
MVHAYNPKEADIRRIVITGHPKQKVSISMEKS